MDILYVLRLMLRLRQVLHTVKYVVGTCNCLVDMLLSNLLWMGVSEFLSVFYGYYFQV